MNTSGTTTAPPPHPAPAGREVGRGRYVLDPGAGVVDGPQPALDTRLGRRVLVQQGIRATPSAGVAARLVRVEHAGLGPLLDAGDDPQPDGSWNAWTVFPAWDWRPLVGPATPWPDLDLAVVAGAVAWLGATVDTTQTAVGPTVAPRSGDVVVDPALFDGTSDPDACPVRWLPSPAATGVDIAAVLAPLATRGSRREQRTLTTAFARLATPYGRRRATRELAELAGLDPRLLGLAPHAPHHAGPTSGRRPTGRRSLVGTIPAITRSEVPCESVEACS